jgi:hypothetical protein
VASLRRSVIVLLCGLACIQPVRVHPAAAPEEPVKAVFLFNFAHFVQWPAGTFATSTQPFVIALAGGEELVPYLEEVVRGETVNGHPLRVTPLRGAPQGGAGHILFIGRSAAAQLPRILQDAPPGALTVSDLPDSARNGVMIELVNERNRIRLRVNLAAARAAGLTISSNLLRPAEIVGNGGR